MKENALNPPVRESVWLVDSEVPSQSKQCSVGSILALLSLDDGKATEIRQQIHRQILMQRAVFEERLSNYWSVSLAELELLGESRAKIAGMRFVRLIDLKSKLVRLGHDRSAIFGNDSLACYAGIDLALEGTILENLTPSCVRCHSSMIKTNSMAISEIAQFGSDSETLILAGSILVESDSTLRLEQLMDMSQVERVVIEDRILNRQDLRHDSTYSLSERVADFGRKLPKLMLVFDSVTLPLPANDQARLALRLRGGGQNQFGCFKYHQKQS